MASPNIFLSSPSRSARRRSHFSASSSPALPSLQEILSQTSKNLSSRLGNKAVAISEDAKTVTNIQSHSSEAQPRVALRAPSANKPAILEIEDSSVFVVEMPADPAPKPRKPRQRKAAAEKCKAAPKKRADKTSPTKDQPRKKRKSKTEADKKSKDVSGQKDTTEVVPCRQGGDSPSAQTSSSPVTKAASKASKAKKDVANEPLQLEPAMTRRLDWTPPTKKAPIVLDSDSSALRDPRSSAGPCEVAKDFEQLLQTYKCKDSTLQDSTAISDDDLGFLRKRKLIELVATTAPNIPAAQVPEKSPSKQKAPRKRPRTITELATAAYRAPSPSEPAQATASLARNVSRDGTNAESDKTVDQGKGKAKPRKRTSKAKKKPPPPPKPILLPPSEALKEVANQDFVFGTSSQLAVEKSPTFLRDLQAAMEHSNRHDYIDLDTPLNSDVIEPPEERPKMWHAGARDAEGDLFDLEMSEIAAKPSQPLLSSQEDDPFGYFRGGQGYVAPACKGHGAHGSQQNGPFVDISDGPYSPGIKSLEIIDDDFSFSDSQIFTGSPVRKRLSPLAGDLPKASSIDTQPATTDQKNVPCQVESQHQPPRPSYELYTDAQLSKEIDSYGLKAVKSRKTKIALLEKCWQGKAQLGPSSVGTIVTASTTIRKVTADKEANQKAAATGGKRPRGRPRKNSVVSSPEAQEPPPSAQRPESPKRPRGRPRNNATASPERGVTISKKTSTAAKLPEAPSTPKPKTRSSKAVIEIPDSASECGSDSSTTPRSSPEPTFSPAPAVDLSLSVNDDTNIPLVLDAADEQSGIFSHITKAIRSAPRTTDPANPSWHEKILLYDPILLEDLTAWLNSGQLTGVGFDEEVSTADVKKWCESRSICCLWRVNLRGKERKGLFPTS